MLGPILAKSNANRLKNFIQTRLLKGWRSTLSISRFQIRINIDRYGSIRFQKEQVVKKQQVFKYLLRLCVIRCIRPDKVVPEIMRF